MLLFILSIHWCAMILLTITPVVHSTLNRVTGSTRHPEDKSLPDH
jgi:hypothetical protein